MKVLYDESRADDHAIEKHCSAIKNYLYRNCEHGDSCGTSSLKFFVLKNGFGYF